MAEAAPKRITVEQYLAGLPIRMSEREFRRKVRSCGCYEHRKQLFLTEADFTVFLETVKVVPCRSIASSMLPAPSTASVVATSRERLVLGPDVGACAMPQ
jgi:hypothetical protein